MLFCRFFLFVHCSRCPEQSKVAFHLTYQLPNNAGIEKRGKGKIGLYLCLVALSLGKNRILCQQVHICFMISLYCLVPVKCILRSTMKSVLDNSRYCFLRHRYIKCHLIQVCKMWNFERHKNAKAQIGTRYICLMYFEFLYKT